MRTWATLNDASPCGCESTIIISGPVTRDVSKLIVIQVRAGYAAEDLGTPLPDDPVKPAQLCRALQFHDVGGRPVERPGEIKVD